MNVSRIRPVRDVAKHSDAALATEEAHVDRGSGRVGRGRRKVFGWLLVLAIIAPAVAYVFFIGTAASTGELFAQAANVEFVPDGGVLERLFVQDRRPLHVRDKVNVDGWGEAHLRFSDFLLLRLFRDSELALERLPTPDAPPIAEVRLNAGTVLTGITADEEGERRVTLRTDFARITDLGTEFFTYYDAADGTTWVVVIEGTASVEAAGVEVRVDEGFQTWVKAGKPPRTPIPAVRELIGDRFPIVDDLTRRALTDEEVLAGTLPETKPKKESKPEQQPAPQPAPAARPEPAPAPAPAPPREPDEKKTDETPPTCEETDTCECDEDDPGCETPPKCEPPDECGTGEETVGEGAVKEGTVQDGTVKEPGTGERNTTTTNNETQVVGS